MAHTYVRICPTCIPKIIVGVAIGWVVGIYLSQSFLRTSHVRSDDTEQISAGPLRPAQHRGRVNLFIDLNGVLVKRDQHATVRELGIFTAMRIGNPAKFEKRLLDFLALVPPLSSDSSWTTGSTLPPIMTNWLRGLCTGQQALAQVQKTAHSQESFFVSRSEKTLIMRICEMMFCPQTLIRMMSPVREGFAFLKYFAEQYRVIVTTNWDKESFEVLRQDKRFADIFTHAELAIVSSHIGHIKPDAGFFKQACCEAEIDPSCEAIIYIDDEEVNLQGAQALKYPYLYALKCDGTNYRELTTQVEQVLREFECCSSDR